MSQSPSPNSPASPSEAKSALIALFEAFPADRGEGTSAVATYLIAIDGYSLKSIRGAVKRLIRGEVDDVDRRFLPSPAQLGNVCAYLEKLYAPVERKLALPSPDDLPPENDEAAWQRRRELAEAAKARFAPPSSPVMKPMTEAEFDTWARQEMVRVRKESDAGRYRLSEAAMQIIRNSPRLSDEEYRKFVPSPDEQFDAWDSARLPPSLPNKERNAA